MGLIRHWQRTWNGVAHRPQIVPKRDLVISAAAINHQWLIGQSGANVGYLDGAYGGLTPDIVQGEKIDSLRVQSDNILYLVPADGTPIDGAQAAAVSFTANSSVYNIQINWGGAFYFSAPIAGLNADVTAELANTLTVTGATP